MRIENIVSEIRHHIWEKSWLDFSLYACERSRLVIVGSDDLCYYHTVEIVAENPSFIQNTSYWTCDINEVFIGVDLERGLKKLAFYYGGEVCFSVSADKFSVNFDTVFYYKKAELLQNQRIAHWVK